MTSRDDGRFLGWVADRLVHVYGDDEHADFIHKLRRIAKFLSEGGVLPIPDPTPKVQLPSTLTNLAKYGSKAERKTARRNIRANLCKVLDDHMITYWFDHWDGRNEHYKAKCKTCGELPEMTHVSDHQAKMLAKWLRENP